MNLSYTTTMLLMFLLCTAASILLIMSIILGIRSWKSQRRSYILVAIFLLFQIIGMSLYIYNAFTGKDLSSMFQQIMKTGPIICGYLPSIAFIAYIANLKNPGWLTWKRYVISLIPFLVIIISLISLQDSFTEINTIHDIPEVIGKPDVIVRLTGLALYLIYAAAIFFIPENAEKRQTSKTNLILLQTSIVIVSTTFIFGLGFNMPVIQLVHVPILLAIDFLIFKIELSSRQDCGRC